MKRIFGIIMVLVAPLAGIAQDVIHLPAGESVDRGFANMVGTIVVLYIVVNFILTMVRSIQDHRLRTRLIEKGVSDKIIEQFLQPTISDAKTQILKWCLIFFGLGFGLALVSRTAPLGIHSFAIMSFSFALSFLAYYLL